MAADLSLVIRATDHASGVLKGVEKSASGLGHMMGNVLKAGALGAAAGLGALAVAGISFIKQAMVEQESISRLAAAVDANSGSWVKQGEAIEKAIKARQRLAFDDEELRTSLALLVAQTGNVDEAMRRQVVAMDLARGAGIDLSSASRLLGKVTDESHAALSRLGIVIDKDADAAEVLAAVQARFGGQAEAFAGTAAGKWARVGIAFDNIKEVIGGALLPIFTKLADKLATFLEESEEDIGRVAEAFTKWAEETIPKVVKALQPIAEWFAEKIPPIVDAVTDFGEQALPKVIEALEDVFEAIKPTLEKLEDLADWFAHNKEAMTAAAIAIGVAMAAAFTIWAVTATAAAVATILAAAPVYALIVAVALLAAGIFILIKHWDEVTKWVKEHQTAVLAIGAAFMVLLPPLGLLIVAVALAIKHWDEISWVINHVVIPAFNTVMTVINDVVIPAVSGLASFFVDTLIPTFASVVQVIADVVIWLQDNLVAAVNTAKGVFDEVGTVFSDPFRIAYNFAKKLVEQIDKLIEKIPQIPGAPDLSPGFNAPGVPFIGGQHGFHGFVNRPTMFMAGEGGLREHVDITPGGGGMGGSVTINVYGAEGQSVNDLALVVRDKIRDLQRRGR